VVTVGRDENGDIRDIRGPLWISVGVVQVGLWVLIFLALMTLVIWWIRRRRSRSGSEADVESGPPPRPPHEVALEALAELQASPMLERGQVKEYHILVSDILRTYVEGHFRVHALEMTTGEVLGGLDEVGVEDQTRADFKRFLESCDLVKFAKVRPGVEESERVLVLGRSIVEESMSWRQPEPEPEPEPEPHPAPAEGTREGPD
jgi:hypothetical protein